MKDSKVVCKFHADRTGANKCILVPFVDLGMSERDVCWSIVVRGEGTHWKKGRFR